MKNRWTLLGIVVVLGTIADQVTKYLAATHLKPIRFHTVIDGFFNLNYSTNPGAFFSLGASLDPTTRRILFVVATIAAMGLIGRLYQKAHELQRALKWALALLLAGAVGNLIDRVLYGEVIDFVQLHYKDVFRWATFNIADVWITFGLVLLVYDLIFPVRLPKAETEAETAKAAAAKSSSARSAEAAAEREEKVDS